MIGATISHYLILERLGKGGMGEVYLAEDLTLRRQVALKLCVDAAASGRLLREARVASALNHPGIAVIYEVGEAEHAGATIGFIAMELVRGRTLAQLAEQGTPASSWVLEIALQAAEALAEAHAHGIVHRDIKPGNIIATDDDRVKVLDFGLARYIPLADEAAPTLSGWDRELGAPGALLGTIQYMSPEQARGLELDGRSDIFSLGVVLYELLAGRPPFVGANAVEVFDAILHFEPPAPPVDAATPGLAPVVMRMLAKDRDRRPSGMRELVAELGDVREGRTASPPAIAPASERVAVMAFTNISRRPEDDWLGTGFAETLASDLERTPGLTLLPPERVHEVSRKLAQRGLPASALALHLGRELGARYVIGGGYQRSGDAIRVTAGVTDVAAGVLGSAAKADGAIGDIFALQDKIARDITGRLRPGPLAEQRAAQETQVLAAYEAYTKGLVNLRAESPESIDRAIDFFERAIQLDPGYARAHLELGDALGVKGLYLGLPELQRRSLACFERALALQPNLAEAWREMGSALVYLRREDEAIAAIERALALDPGSAAAHSALARAYFIGKADFARAADSFERALALNPQAGWSALQLAHCAALLRDFLRGEGAALRAIILQEELLSGKEGVAIVGAYMRLGHLFALQGRHAEARLQFERELEFLARVDHALKARVFIELHARLGASRQALGDAAGARRALDLALESFERRLRLGNDEPFTRYYAAAAYALAGDRDAAFDSLARAIASHPTYARARARIEPEFAGLREDPRFASLMADPGPTRA